MEIQQGWFKTTWTAMDKRHWMLAWHQDGWKPAVCCQNQPKLDVTNQVTCRRDGVSVVKLHCAISQFLYLHYIFCQFKIKACVFRLSHAKKIAIKATFKIFLRSFFSAHVTAVQCKKIFTPILIIILQKFNPQNYHLTI